MPAWPGGYPGFHCWEAVEAYQQRNCRFILVARKTSRRVDVLQAVDWRPAPRIDADGQCEIRYQPESWGKAHRFLALRCEKKPKAREADQPEQYQLFDTPEYTYRLFVTDMERAPDALVWFYNQRAGAENLIKESNNDAGLAAQPSNRWMTNCNYFQIAMLAYNLNCRLLLFSPRRAKRQKSSGTPGWPQRACGFCSWRPRSGATPGELASAIATITKRKASCND